MIVSRETVMLAEFGKVKSRWKRSAGTFPRPQCCKRDTGRSGLTGSHECGSFGFCTMAFVPAVGTRRAVSAVTPPCFT